MQSFEKRTETIYLPKDICRLIDMLTTFALTLCQVELHLCAKAGIKTAPTNDLE